MGIGHEKGLDVVRYLVMEGLIDQDQDFRSDTITDREPVKLSVGGDI